ncbi:MAG: phosphoribosyltransferase [Burkholderiales bacterium]|nr:phosphoribosyltransferase [Burkholderiales bacterium]
MPPVADDHLWISWDDYHRAIEELALLVHKSGWHFDQVLCLARGGLRIGDVFSRIFSVPLAILSTSSYRKNAGTVRSPLDIAKHITMPTGTLEGRILLIDDLVDSGVTLRKVQQHVHEHFPGVTGVKTAVIWYKACSAVRPDYYLEYLPNNPWIHQPFEEYDGMGVEGIEKKLLNK